jgi:hypothetical protein
VSNSQNKLNPKIGLDNVFKKTYELTPLMLGLFRWSGMRTPRPTGKMLALRVVVDQAELVGWCEGPAVRSTLQRNLGSVGSYLSFQSYSCNL